MMEFKKRSAAPPEQFSDGKLEFGVIATLRENGKKIGEEFAKKGELFFNRLNIRQSDYDLRGATDQTIDLKLKTFFIKDVSSESHKVLIGEDEYDIYALDADLDERYLYWYLAKVGRFNGERNA